MKNESVSGVTTTSNAILADFLRVSDYVSLEENEDLLVRAFSNEPEKNRMNPIIVQKYCDLYSGILKTHMGENIDEDKANKILRFSPYTSLGELSFAVENNMTKDFSISEDRMGSLAIEMKYAKNLDKYPVHYFCNEKMLITAAENTVHNFFEHALLHNGKNLSKATVIEVIGKNPYYATEFMNIHPDKMGYYKLDVDIYEKIAKVNSFLSRDILERMDYLGMDDIDKKQVVVALIKRMHLVSEEDGRDMEMFLSDYITHLHSFSLEKELIGAMSDREYKNNLLMLIYLAKPGQDKDKALQLLSNEDFDSLYNRLNERSLYPAESKNCLEEMSFWDKLHFSGLLKLQNLLDKQNIPYEIAKTESGYRISYPNNYICTVYAEQSMDRKDNYVSVYGYSYKATMTQMDEFYYAPEVYKKSEVDKITDAFTHVHSLYRYENTHGDRKTLLNLSKLPKVEKKETVSKLQDSLINENVSKDDSNMEHSETTPDLECSVMDKIVKLAKTNVEVYEKENNTPSNDTKDR